MKEERLMERYPEDSGTQPEEQEPALTLEELLAQVTDENIHEEVDFGLPVGREIW